MKTEDNYSSKQLDRLVNEIEGRLNDFEGGISEKDETIKSFASFIYECAANAVNNALAEHDREIIALIDEIRLKTDDYHDEDERQARWNVLTELKQKILETKK